MVNDEFPDCKEHTEHFSSGCALLLHYDEDSDGVISEAERLNAFNDYTKGEITLIEAAFVAFCNKTGTIDDVCPGCYKKKLTSNTILYIVMAIILISLILLILQSSRK